MRRTAWLLMIAGVFAGVVAGWYLRGDRGVAHLPPDSVVAVLPASREILYYRNPMGLADTSPVPKKDSMGMDYVPVYADQTASPEGMVLLDAGKIQKLGVRSTRAERRALVHRVRASAQIEVDESRRHIIAPKFAGWVERLRVNQTGMVVHRGEPLADLYSPELVSAQEEYLIARAALARLGEDSAQRSMRELADAALARLANWDISAAELRALDQGEVQRSLALLSPVDAVVLEKRAIEGMYFEAGTTLFALADLSQVWLIVETGMLDSPGIATGQTLAFTTPALPGQVFEGRISFVYPTVSEPSRTLKFRATLPNPRGVLRPALLGEAVISTGDNRLRIVVPHSAVIDSGIRRIVLIAHPGGRFEPREVRLGQRGDEFVEVLDGVQEGESVVVAANFLIDAESNLKASLQAFGAHQGHDASSSPEPADAAGTTAHEGH